MSTAVQPAPSQFAPTESQLALAYSVCRSITRSSARNFFYAFVVLPKAKRQALCAVYAFMRRCDDISDEAGMSPGERREKLAAWLDGLHRALAGYPTDDPVHLALTDAQRRFNIPVELLDQLASGTAMDVVGETDRRAPKGITVQYATFEDLYQYCYRVASVVGLVCIRIFGYRDPAAEPLAEQCGLAFQLTNIIRDVKEDAGMGRVYLPDEDLVKFGISPLELGAATNPVRYAPLLAMEAERAHGYYKSVEGLLPLVDEDSQPALWVLTTIYRNLLEKIASRQYDVFNGKVALSTREKLAILGGGFWRRLT